jgi:4-aminobutyrate aminotransferase/(S)-3-amino-2-methylpropionate transaminase
MGKVLKGSIGGTYTGNPVSAAVAIKVIEIMRRDKICERAERLGKIMSEYLEGLKNKYDVIGDHRGLGVMRAVELVKDPRTKEPAKSLTDRVLLEARRRGLLLLEAGYYGNVIRFHPPLTISEENLLKGLEIFEESLRAALS